MHTSTRSTSQRRHFRNGDNNRIEPWSQKVDSLVQKGKQSKLIQILLVEERKHEIRSVGTILVTGNFQRDEITNRRD